MTAPKTYARIFRFNETDFRLVLSPNSDPFAADVEVHGFLRGDIPHLSITSQEGNYSAVGVRGFIARMVIAADLIDRLSPELPTSEVLRAALLAVAPDIDLF